MQPSRLWSLRRAIFGHRCGAGRPFAALLLTAIGILTGFPSPPPFVAGAGSSSPPQPSSCRFSKKAARWRLQGAAHRLHPPPRRSRHRAASGAGRLPRPERGSDRLGGAGDGGRHRHRHHRRARRRRRYLLNPFFRLLAESRAREVMTAAALLVVLGSAHRHADGGPLHGDGRLPRRRAPVRIDLPPPARGRHRALPRHSPRPVLLAVGMSLDLTVVSPTGSRSPSTCSPS